MSWSSKIFLMSGHRPSKFGLPFRSSLVIPVDFPGCCLDWRPSRVYQCIDQDLAVPVYYCDFNYL